MARFLALVALAAGLMGCSAIDRLTGDLDNSVLPGAREDAIPGRSQFPDPADSVPIEQPGGGQTVPEQAEAATARSAPAEPAPCAAGDPDCAPTTDDVFADPQ
jgi:hypothetical protein